MSQVRLTIRRLCAIVLCLLLISVQGRAQTAVAAAPETPLPPREKMLMAVDESFDWAMLAFTGGVAYLYYIQHTNPSFGYGLSGYGKRYAAATADTAIGNLLGVGILPSILHEDPRYVPSDRGPIRSRIEFAVRQAFIARTDSGKWRFAYSQWFGAAGALAISNIYYRDSRTIPVNLEKFGIQIAGNAGVNVLEEFWPDLKRHLLRRRRH